MFTLVTFVVLCLCLFELTAGLYLRRVKASRKRREAIDAIHYLKSSENFGPRGKFEHSPYGLYWNTKNYFVGSLRQTDSLGYRSHREAFEEKKPDEYLVLVLGSSTTYSDHFSLNPNASWPSRAEELLNQSELLEGRKIRVVNAGLNYATTGELLCHFIFRGKYLNPDLVILDGPGNDFLPAANGDNTTDYRKTRHSIYFNKRRGEKLLLKSRIVQCIYLFVVTSKNLIVMEPPNFKLGADLEQNELLKSNDGRIVKSNVESLIAIVKEMNIHLILVDFLRPSPKVMMDNYPLVWEGLGVFESTISQHYSDLSLKHPDRVLHIRSDEFHQLLDKDFHDVCHLTIEGDLKKAYVITNALTNWLSKKLR